MNKNLNLLNRLSKKPLLIISTSLGYRVYRNLKTIGIYNSQFYNHKEAIRTFINSEQLEILNKSLYIKVDIGDWVRAGGDCICQVCKKAYKKHRHLPGNYYWLNELCDGTLVKL